MWKTVPVIFAFQRMFGKPNMLIVDNSDGKNYEKETVRAYRDAMKFLKKPPQSQKAQNWINKKNEEEPRVRLVHQF